MTMTYLIKAENLSYKINEKKLFQNISFEVNSNSAIHITGSNGSGKTTLLRIILGISKPTRGIIETNLNSDICYLGHKNALKQYLTVEDNLILQSIQHNKILDELLKNIDLYDKMDVVVSNLSFGQQKKIALLKVFFNESELLVLDEPCVGLDDKAQTFLTSFLQRELDKNKSIIFSSHINLNIDAKSINLDK